MDAEVATQRYLLTREMGIWEAEAERAQNRLDDLDDLLQDGPEEAMEQAWYYYSFHKHKEVAWELDKIENPQKHSVGAVLRRESLDDLDRQTG